MVVPPLSSSNNKISHEKRIHTWQKEKKKLFLSYPATKLPPQVIKFVPTATN
jgi:hypothetical protein